MLTPETVLQNRYKLERQLNENPARQTWLAEDLEVGDRVALKLLALGGTIRWEELKLFEREAQVLKHLDHPSIPKYRDYFSLDEQTLWFGLVQDYIPGETLKQKLRAGKMSPQQAFSVAAEVLEILNFLHNLVPPLLHRDIKPSNLIWGEDDRIYLVDFGAVQARPNRPGATFTVVGTYGYAPIEQYGGQAVPASDLYALGATLVHLLTGVSPAELPQEDVQLQFRDRLPPQIDPPSIVWLEKLVQPSLKRRFSSAKEALEGLKNKTSPDFPQTPTSARIYRSPQRLDIFIPSRFELEVLQGAKEKMRWLGAKAKEWGSQLIEYFRSLDRQTQQGISSGIAIAAVCILALDLLTSASLVESAFYLTLVLLTAPLGIFASLLPLLFVAWAIAAHSDRGDYFQTTRISFNASHFEIQQDPSRHRRRERGKIDDIEAIELTNFVDASRQLRHSLAISTLRDRKLLFLSSQHSRNYLFGQQLSPFELRQLQREIQDWLLMHQSDRT